MAKEFMLMNVLIKGTAASIKRAISVEGIPEHKVFSRTCDLRKIDPESKKIEKVGLVFQYGEYLLLDQIPFTTMPDIKFIAMADGDDFGRLDGTYSIYKDFGETKVSVCRRFTNASICMEEFECEEELVDRVFHSFLDHTWSFNYDDFSDGRLAKYAFGTKKDLELIALWEDDAAFAQQA